MDFKHLFLLFLKKNTTTVRSFYLASRLEWVGLTERALDCWGLGLLRTGFIGSRVCRGLGLLRAGVELPALPRPPGGLLVGWEESREEMSCFPLPPGYGTFSLSLHKLREGVLVLWRWGQKDPFPSTPCHYFTLLMTNMLVRSLPNFSMNIYDFHKHH